MLMMISCLGATNHRLGYPPILTIPWFESVIEIQSGLSEKFIVVKNTKIRRELAICLLTVGIGL